MDTFIRIYTYTANGVGGTGNGVFGFSHTIII